MAEQKHILIVDDDIELGTLLAKAVADMSPSYTVKVARDVDEAMVQVRRSQTTENMFDLVITDIKMTGLNGLELLEALHALVPELRTIAMTAYTSSDIANRAEELGVQAYLTKPFMISEFRNVVRTTLDAPPRDGVTRAEPVVAHTPAPPQQEKVSRALSSLRTMTAADAAFLLRQDGTLIAADARDAGRKVNELAAALQAAQQAITEQMVRLFDQSCAVRQSFFGTDAYSVCTYRINGTYSAAVIFGPEVREGQVWYYMRDAASTLARILGAEASVSPVRRRGADESVRDMLDRFFPNAPRSSAHDAIPAPDTMPRSLDAAPPPPIQETEKPNQTLDGRKEPGREGSPSTTASDDQAAHAPAPSEKQETEAMDPSVADGIDWDGIEEMSWDDILEEADRDWEGISFEEARRLGLIDDLEGS
jgi:DNA-binding response OmpR family regulator